MFQIEGKTNSYLLSRSLSEPFHSYLYLGVGADADAIKTRSSIYSASTCMHAINMHVTSPKSKRIQFSLAKILLDLVKNGKARTEIFREYRLAPSNIFHLTLIFSCTCNIDKLLENMPYRLWQKMEIECERNTRMEMSENRGRKALSLRAG